MDAYKEKNAACEVRDKYYTKHWQVQVFETVTKSPGYCCYAMWCPCCSSYQLRQRVLRGDMTRYLCCGGYLPCSGRCGEAKCPKFCLCMEATCCFAQSVASTRWMIQDEMQIQNTKCDNCLIGTMIALQYLSCIISCVAMFVDNDGVRQAAHIIDCIADAVWCSVCGCMQTQHKVQLDARDADPSLIMPLSPYMAPIQQAMGVPMYPQQQQQQQQGGYGGGGYPPPSAYPPPPPSGYSGNPQQQPYSYPPPADYSRF